jgi:hypothetical protein
MRRRRPAPRSPGRERATPVWLLCLACALGWALPAVRAHAQALVQGAPDAAAVVAEAKTALERAQFSAAESLLTDLLAREALGARERNDALELFAIVQIAERKEAKAREALQLLLSRDPDHHRRVLDPGPAVDAAFARVKQSPTAALQVPLRFSLSRDASARPLLAVELGEGRDAVESVHVFLPEAGASSSPHLVSGVSGDQPLRLVLPEAPRARTQLALYLEARAPSGAVLGRLGDASAPVYLALPRVDAPAPPCTVAPKPLRQRWWVWTTVGLVISGVVVASAVTAD